MGAVTWAVVTSKIARISDWNTAQMGTHTKDNQELWISDSVFVRLGITQAFSSDRAHLIDLILVAVADEQWFPTPFDGGVFADWDGGQVDFHLCSSQNVSRCTHTGQEVQGGIFTSVRCSHAQSSYHKVGERPSRKVSLGTAYFRIFARVTSVFVEAWNVNVGVAEPLLGFSQH